jgi:hypothetical protein
VKELGFLAVFMASVAAPTIALCQEGHPVGILGVGNSSCGSWTSWKAGGDMASIAKAAAAQGWAQGFITAMAVESAKVNVAIHKTDAAGLDAWIDNWCKSHPLSSIAKAAEALAINLDGQ